MLGKEGRGFLDLWTGFVRHGGVMHVAWNHGHCSMTGAEESIGCVCGCLNGVEMVRGRNVDWKLSGISRREYIHNRDDREHDHSQISQARANPVFIRTQEKELRFKNQI